MLVRQPAGDLLGRPSHRKAVADEIAQGGLARQLVAASASSSSPGQFDGPLGAVAAARPAPAGLAVASELAADGAEGAHQQGGDLAARLAGGMQPADRLALCIGELVITGSHRSASLAGALHLFRELRGSTRAAGFPLSR